MSLELEKEFEEIKQQHMVKTCFCYALTEVEEEVTKQVNLPPFLLKGAIAQEAKDRVLDSFRKGEESFRNYYEKAYDTLSQLI